MVEQLARYVPGQGWRAILAVAALPEARPRLRRLARPLGMLIRRHGHELIDRIELT